MTSARERLERVLRHLIASLSPPSREGCLVLASPLTSRELGELVGVTREHVLRIIAALEATGIVRRERVRPRNVVLLPIAYWGMNSKTG
jgi:CRP-like cAMP-binding protein